MNPLLEKLGKLAELIGRKHLPAKITLAWLILRALLASRLELIELRAYCHQNMHWMDLLAIISTACMACELLHLTGAKILALTHRRIVQLHQRHIQTSGVAEGARILNGPDSREKHILTELLQTPQREYNPLEPSVKHLAARGLIVPSGLTTTDPLGALHSLYSLSQPLLHEMETHRRH